MTAIGQGNNKGWFFGLNAAVYVTDVVDTSLKGADYFQSLGWEYPFAMTINFLGSLVAMRVSSRPYQWVFALASLAYNLSWALREFGTL